MNSESDLEHVSNLADARLEVAELLRWPLAGLAGAVIHLKWDSLIISFFVTVGVFVLSVMPYRKASDKAEDEYHMAARLGKYSRAMRPDDGNSQ